MRLLRVTPLFVFALLATTLAVFVVRGEGEKFGAGILDRPLPDFDQEPIAGFDRGFSSAELAGKVSLVNVFAAWCSACREEHPQLMAMAAKKRVPLYGLDWRDRPGAGKVFLQDRGNPYLAVGDDSSGTLGRRLGVTGVPETYVVDRQGRIRYRHVGPISPAIWADALLPMIARLEAETP